MGHEDTLRSRGFQVWDRCSVCPPRTIKESWGSHAFPGIVFVLFTKQGRYNIKKYSIEVDGGEIANLENEINDKIIKHNIRP